MGVREGLLREKILLVNGGSQGVGAAIARAAVREGAVVAVTGRRTEPGEALVAELAAAGGTAVSVRADPADAGQAGAAVAGMVARKAPGTVLHTITSSAHGGQPFLAPYVAARAGLAGLTGNAAHAHRWDRIRINGLNIGWTATEGEDATQRAFHGAGDDWREQAAARLPMGRLGRPDEIAGFVVFLLSGRSGVVTGSVIDWDQNVLGALD
ncbi:SDR family oxidoreductase [Streptomyces sp. NPDC001851]|uniref:SDR family oxidoreductase n=1 Tax=Streptomyces sp. NPDC001851 TaxID=3154529 RepID=UPI0033168900